MSRNRYVKDYRLVENVNERGRIKTTYEYIGEDYYFAADAGTVHAARKRLAVVCLIGWIAFIGALLPVSVAGHTLYVTLPFAAAAWPLGLLTGVGISLFHAREPLEHRHADRLENRAPACTFFVALLGGVALIGEAVNALRGAELLPGDGVFAVCAAVLVACAIFCHRQWKRLKCINAE